MKTLYIFIFVIMINYIYTDEWVKFNETFSIRTINQYHDYAFSAKANKIIANVTCSNLCNIYLLEESEFDKFQNNRNFQSLIMELNVTKLDFYFGDITKIRSTVYVVIENLNTFSIEGKVTGELLMPPDKQL
jgi:hypothetical protein